MGQGAVPLVLLHGAGFDHAELTFRAAIGPLSKLTRVIAIDLPGYGESEGFGRSHDLGDLSSWLGRFLDNIGVERVDISGVSMGGGMALRFALDQPDRVRRLIPVGTYGIMARAPYHPLAWRFARSSLSRSVYAISARSAFLTRVGLGAAFAKPFAIPDAVIRNVQAVARDQYDRQTFRDFLTGEITPEGLRGNLLDRLPEIMQPTLLIHGTRDLIVPLRHARRAVRKLRDGGLHIMETGHWPMREHPDAYNAVVADFIAGDTPVWPQGSRT